MSEHTHVKSSWFTPWKAGDRVLIEVVVESVFDGASNWPIKIVLDAGDSETVDCSRNVHYSAIHPLEGPSDALVKALEKIEKWFGEFPETGRFWDDDKTRPITYGAAFGSNGERDFMRSIAREAIAKVYA